MSFIFYSHCRGPKKCILTHCVALGGLRGTICSYSWGDPHLGRNKHTGGRHRRGLIGF